MWQRLCLALLPIGVAAALAGCDSLRGTQEPIDAPATTVAAAKEYPPAQAITAFYSGNVGLREGLTPQQYRDKVVALRLLAIDAQYRTFVTELRGAKSGVALGADIATLVLGGVGTFVAGETTKSVLAAATAVIAGTRVSIDKNLFYDQTLPALVAQMDAERAKQRLIIEENLLRGASQYSLADAFKELSEYERLGSIETAIRKITGSATEEANKAESVLKTFQRTKDFVSPDMSKLRNTLLDKVKTLDDGRAIMAATRLAGGSELFRNGDAARQYLSLKIRFESDNLAALNKVSDAL